MPKGIELFKQRFEGYDGEVRLVDSEQAALREAIGIVVEAGVKDIGLSRDLKALQPLLDGVGVDYTHEMKGTQPPDIGITRASGILAETGSLVIDNANPGERLWSIIPETHIAILSRPRLFQDLNELFESGSELLNTGFCLISGPSRTADIEKQLILGMHGPRKVIVILAG